MKKSHINLHPRSSLPCPNNDTHANPNEKVPGRPRSPSQNLPGGTVISVQTLLEEAPNRLPLKKRPVNQSFTPSSTLESNDEEDSSFQRTNCANTNGDDSNETVPVVSLEEALEEAQRLPLKKRPFQKVHIDPSSGETVVVYPEYQTSIPKRNHSSSLHLSDDNSSISTTR